MDAVKDFLLEYYVWVLAVLVILLITVIGFLADTKKKRKMREKVMKEETSEVNNNVGGDMVMEQNTMMDQGMNMNANVNGFDIPSGSNDVNEMNNAPSANIGNDSYFVPSSAQTPNIEPMEVPNVATPGANFGNVNGPAMEPTSIAFPMPSENVSNAMTPNNMEINNMPNNIVNNIPVQEPVFNSSMNNDMMNNIAQQNKGSMLDNITMPILEQNGVQENPIPNNNLNPFMNNGVNDNNLNNAAPAGVTFPSANNTVNNGPVAVNPIPMPEAVQTPAFVMPNVSQPTPVQPIMNGGAPVVNMNPGYPNVGSQPMNPGIPNSNVISNQQNQLNNGQFNNY